MTKQDALTEAKKRLLHLRKIPEFHGDKDVILAYMDGGYSYFSYASNELKENREFAILALRKQGKALKFLNTEMQKDLELVEIALTSDGEAFKFLPVELSTLDKLQDLSLETSAVAYQYLSDERKRDKKIIKKAISKGLDIEEIPLDIRYEKSIVKHVMKVNPGIIQDNDYLKDDEDAALNAVMQGSWMFPYISDRLKSDKAFALRFVETNGSKFKSIFKYFDDVIKDDKAIALTSMKFTNGKIFMELNDRLRADKELIKLALTYDLDLKEYAIEEVSNNISMDEAFDLVLSDPDKIKGLTQFKDNSEFVWRCIERHAQEEYNYFYDEDDEENDGEDLAYSIEVFLPHIDSNLFKDLEFLLKLIDANDALIKFLPDNMLNNREFVYQYAQKLFMKHCKDGKFVPEHFYEYIPQHFLDDRNFLLFCIKYGAPLYIANETLLDDEIFVLDAMALGAVATSRTLSKRLRSDKAFVLKVCEKYNFQLDYSSLIKKVRDDNDVISAISGGYEAAEGKVLEVFSDNKRAFMKAVESEHGYNTLINGSGSILNDKEVIMHAVSYHSNALRDCNDRFRDDEEVVLAAVRNDGSALEFASDRLKSDRSIVIKAVLQKGFILEFASKEFRDDIEVMRTAIISSPLAFQFASSRLKNNREFVEEMLEKSEMLLPFKLIGKKLKRNKDFLLAYLVRYDLERIDSLNTDSEYNYLILDKKNIPENLRDDLDVVRVALDKEVGGY